MDLLGLSFSERSGDDLIEVVPRGVSCAGQPSHRLLATDGSPMAHVAFCSEAHEGLVVSLRSGVRACIAPSSILLDAGPADRATLEHDLANIIAPLAASRDRIVLHGAMVVRGDAAVVAVAPSGTGKSTLAEAAHSAGIQTLSDDTCAIVPAGEGWTAIAGAPVLSPRAPDGSGDRTRIDLGLDQTPRRLASILIAERGAEPAITPLSPAEAAVAVLSNSFLLDHDPESLRAWMSRIAQLCRRIPVCSLTVPEGVPRIPEVLPLIDELLE